MITTFTIGAHTFDLPTDCKPVRATQPQLKYICLLAEEIGETLTDDQMAFLDGLLYDETSSIIDQLKSIASEIRQAKKDAERAKYTHLPNEVGTKTLVDGVVTSTVIVNSVYGESYKLTVIVQDAYRVEIFTSAEWASATNNGDIVSIAGTVKEHREWRGAWSTVLSRPSLKSIERK